MDILITICARGGSKGIPGKNIKTLNGKPLIYYSLATAAKFASVQPGVSVILSTDDEAVKSLVAASGYEIDSSYSRPAHLASDTAGKIDAIQDVVLYAEQRNSKKYAYVIDLDVTSPLRTVADLTAALALLQADPTAYNIFSVNPANRNPYFNMVEKNEEGYYRTSKEGAFLTRQSTPEVYDMNASFYIYHSSFFEQGLKKAITERSLVYQVPHLCFDLDHPIDFTIMSLLMEHQKLDFDL